MSPKSGLQLPSKRIEASSGSPAPLTLRSKKRSRSATEEHDGYDGPPPKKKKFLGNPEDVVRFRVGPAESGCQLFTLPRKLVVDHSALVARRCRRGGEEVVIRLTNHAPEIFLLYVDFLFDGHIRNSNSSSGADDGVRNIVCLQLLGEELEDEGVTEQTIAQLEEAISQEQPSVEAIDYVYAHTLVATSSLRQIFVRNVAKYHWPAIRSSTQATAMVHRLQFIAEVEKASKEMPALSGADVTYGKSSDASKS